MSISPSSQGNHPANAIASVADRVQFIQTHVIKPYLRDLELLDLTEKCALYEKELTDVLQSYEAAARGSFLLWLLNECEHIE
jgi:hypothetical protein